MKEVDGIGNGCQRGLVGAQRGEPVQDVWIAAQLLEGLHLRVLGAEEIQEIANGAVVETKRLLVEGCLLYTSLALGSHTEHAAFGQWAPTPFG